MINLDYKEDPSCFTFFYSIVCCIEIFFCKSNSRIYSNSPPASLPPSPTSSSPSSPEFLTQPSPFGQGWDTLAQLSSTIVPHAQGLDSSTEMISKCVYILKSNEEVVHINWAEILAVSDYKLLVVGQGYTFAFYQWVQTRLKNYVSNNNHQFQ